MNRARLMPLALVLLFVLAGCTPPGPRALLDGERLIEAGEFQRAVSRLEVATELMPASAQAWNFLGLALHGAGRRQEAAQAYQRAIGLDQDLVVARYNLGCLQLEAGNAEAAAAEFTAFTLGREQSIEGWLKLASAQMRAGKFGAAEGSYARALALDRESAEAWNGLGMALIGRGRAKDAGPYFDKAVSCDPGYAPALLNRAIYQQQHTGNNVAALQSYRAYLALEPRAPDWTRVQQLVSRLESPPQRPAQVAANRTAPAPPVAVAKEKPRDIPEVRNEREQVTPPPPQRTTTSVPKPTETKSTAPAPRPAPRQSQPERVPVTDFEVVQVERPNAIQPARDSAAVRRVEPVASTEPVEVSPPPPAREKPGILARLNPANLFRREPEPAIRPASPTASGVEVSPRVASTGAEPARSPAAARASRPYPYRSDIDLKPGNRAAAQSLFARGAEAHRIRDLEEAVALYESALRADPAYFDVHYNLGLARYQLGDWMGSARAYELALALNAPSARARYNFALALKQGGFFRDAARELEKLLVVHPQEVPARLTLAHLYANELGSPKLARAHYEKVLAQSPAHPESTEIRYWLRANP